MAHMAFAGGAQTEAVGRVLHVVEHVTGGLVDGYGTGVGGRIGLFLACVQLQSLEVKFRFLCS